MAAPNGSLYETPSCAGRIIKLNPIDKSMTCIGPDLGNDGHSKQWCRGAMTHSGVIYCPPFDPDRRGILKIDTNTDTATELNSNLLLERGEDLWISCAAALARWMHLLHALSCSSYHEVEIDANNKSHGFVRNSIQSDLV